MALTIREQLFIGKLIHDIVGVDYTVNRADVNGYMIVLEVEFKSDDRKMTVEFSGIWSNESTPKYEANRVIL